MLCLSAVAASDLNQTEDIQSENNDIEIQSEDAQILQSTDDVETQSNNDSQSLQSSQTQDLLQATYDDSNDNLSASNKIYTKIVIASKSVYVNNNNFKIQLTDSNGTGIGHKYITIVFDGVTYSVKTNSAGNLYFNLNKTGTYTLSYSFKEDGYTSSSGSKVITVVPSKTSKIKGSAYVAYVGVKNPYVVTLTTGGIVMPNQKVIFTIKGKSYTRTTNSKGQATLNINLAKGSYTIVYKFKGTTNAKSASGKSKITVKKGMPTSIVRQNADTYYHKISTPFKVKFRDVRGNPIANKTISFKINNKIYRQITDSTGLAQINITLSKGVYSLKVYSFTDKYLNKVVNTYTIKVKPLTTGNNGFWLFGSDMKKVSLTQLAKYNVDHIFLNSYAIDLYGKTVVSQFACQARDLGIKVHIWMQTFYDGSWISPVYGSGNYKYSLFNSIIAEAKSYASIEGVAGIHFDYLRFPGTAYKHTNGVNAINYFVKKACTQLHALNSSLIVSAAIMPEPSSLKYYYGQDIPTISKYLDVLIPMVYKGNYGAGTSWIKSVTSTLVSQSNGAEVWTGLQSYKSDSNPTKLSSSTLLNDGYYAYLGGATGVILFRYGLFDLFDFSKF